MEQRPYAGFDDPDEELLRSARDAPEGDLRAFEQLVHLYQKRILADCRYLTRDDANSEDLAQEVFVKAFFGLRSFEGRSSFRHWLQRIKVHHCLNHLKKREARTALAIDEAPAEEYEQLREQPIAEQKLEALEGRQRIDAILQSMPTTLRIPLVMRDMDELSYEEIAGALGVGLSAVKMRIKRGRELFRRLYTGAERLTGEPAR
jgi:RNA polymerase sigma-70 factor (ECF subfamily)